MSLVSFPGGFSVSVGIGMYTVRNNTANQLNNILLDAANEAIIAIGHIATSDKGSHTINTTGSSSIGWRSGSVTFANGSTVVKAGIAPVDTANGPPGRASNSTDVISFDVSADFTGGGGGITSNAYQTSVPTTGTKTIAHGDLVAICVQMTARGGADAVNVSANLASTTHRSLVTSYTGGSYAASVVSPNFFVTFADGATGWLNGADVFSSLNSRTWNSGSATTEYGQLYQLPFPCNVSGIYGWIDPDADCDIVLYSDPLGTPVAEKTVSIDANTVASVTGRYFEVYFPAAYSATANQPLGVIFKPGGSNVSAYYKTLGAAGHRITEIYGTDGYGISRASGAFANANSSLDHYYIGLMVNSFDDATGGGALLTNPGMRGGFI